MEIWELDGPWRGRLALCSRPRAGWFLDDDIRALKASGYAVLVSALTPEEVARAELEMVQHLCEAAGLVFAHFPVGNLQVAHPERAIPVLQSWQDSLHSGDGIAIHCWATVGRGPTLAAALLVGAGVPPEDAWERIASARGREVPDTLEQRAWVDQFAANQLAEDAAS